MYRTGAQIELWRRQYPALDCGLNPNSAHHQERQCRDNHDHSDMPSAASAVHNPLLDIIAYRA
jgi:hypothetical protein